jgi:putative transposase
MPWRPTSPMDPPRQLIADYRRQPLSIIEWCELYNGSCKPGDKWIERYRKHGPLGLEERSRQPHSSPHQPPRPVVEAFIELRRHHPAGGAKKRRSMLQKRHPRWPLPARSTVWDLVRRHGLGPKTRRRRHLGQPGQPTSQLLAPNEVGSAAFKGPFNTGDGLYGYPLPVAEGYRRLLLGCQALSSPRVPEAKPVITRVFTAFGLPTRIRTDHGVPLAPNPLARLSPLAAWWGRLGLLPEFLAPGQPHQHGRHERMPRPLNAETARPPAATRRAPQHTCERFRQACNGERPPEALARQTPASRDEASPREMPTKRPPLADPDRVEVRYVSATGGIRWHHPGGNVSHVCVGASVGLEDIDAGVWNVSFGPRTLGRRLERPMRLADADGRLKRRR